MYIFVHSCPSPSTLFTLSHRRTPHLSRRFVSWPLTPPPRSDSTVHNVQTPCRPQQGGRVRGLHCHMHTIRRPLAPVGPSHLHTRWCGVSCIHYYVCQCTYSFTPAPPPAAPRRSELMLTLPNSTLLCIASLCFCLSIYLTVLFFNDDDGDVESMTI